MAKYQIRWDNSDGHCRLGVIWIDGGFGSEIAGTIEYVWPRGHWTVDLDNGLKCTFDTRSGAKEFISNNI